MFNQLRDMIWNLIADSQLFIIALMAIGVIASAILLGLGGQAKREEAKSQILWIWVAIVIVIFVKTFIQYIASKAGVNF